MQHATESASARRAPRHPGARRLRVLRRVRIERYFRNARALIIYEGTTQIHKMMVAEHVPRYRNLNGRDGDISSRVVGPRAQRTAAGCVALALAPAAYAPPRAGTSVPGEPARRSPLGMTEDDVLAAWGDQAWGLQGL